MDKDFQKNSKMTEQHQRDQESIYKLQNELNEEKNKGFIKRLFGKKNR